MIGRSALRLVLLVSCAHSLVHVYELALPSVEQEIAEHYHGDDISSGKQMTGQLSTCWRLPWGLGALIAGWLVDRHGGRKMLAIFLLGCGFFCSLVAITYQLPILYVAMFGMGAIASIYHPAGLSLISNETNAADRPRALGIHGIFGSAGIATAPFLAFGLLALGFSWRGYYWALTLPGILLGLLFVALASRHAKQPASKQSAKFDDEQERADWWSFAVITLLALAQGIIYSAVMSFLPRYLSVIQQVDGQSIGADSTAAVYGKVCAAGVLLIGCVGQYISGRLARPRWLEPHLTAIAAANAPMLLWMALADGWWRVLAAGCFSLVHFMHQPVYNSLVAKYTPRRRRSLCYGLAFAVGFGFGSLGSILVGKTQSDSAAYGWLSIVALIAALLGGVLCYLNSNVEKPQDD